MLLALFVALQATPAAPEALAAERAVVERIFTTELGEGRALAILSGLVTTAPLRLSGSKGAAAAVEWCRAEFERAGLDAVRLEKVMVPHWERGANDRLVHVAVDGSTRPLAMLALGGSIGTPKDGLVAEVIEVKSRDELATLGERAKGKFLFFNQPMDPRRKNAFSAYGGAVWQRGFGAVEAAKVGAVGAIVRSMTLSLDDFPHTGSMRYDDVVAKVPAVAISTLAAEGLAKELAAKKSVRLKLDLQCAKFDDVESANVVAEIRGRERPDEIVLIGAHLDAWDVGHGAHDDGAGCAHVLEAMRLLRALDLKPRRTIRAVLFMNEENGLAGGREYARAHAAELERHVFALESDRGGFSPRGIGAMPVMHPGLAPLVALMEPWGAGQLVDGDGGADISTLQPAGVPLGELLPEDDRYFDYHHCARDVLGAVNERELALGAATVAATAFLIADHAGPWPRAPVVEKQ